MTLPHPRRLTPPAPIGSLLKCAEAPVRPHKNETERDPAYLDMIRQLPCLHCGMEPCYEAAHVRMASAAFGKASGMARKPPDKWAVPLCPDHHRLLSTSQHAQGEEVFWAALGINPLIAAQSLYAKRGDLVAMRAVVFNTIAARG
jgi:hypothetical protein